MKIETVEAAVTDIEADVLVNSTNQALVLKNGSISKSFVKSAGPGLQAECSEKYPDGVWYGDIAVTKGHRLKCKAVYHVAMPPWNCEFADAAEVLCVTVYSCLQQADDDGMASIAFPALGCGFLNYPYDRVAEVMHDCISSFDKNANSPSLKHVFIVIWPKGAEWRHVKQAFDQEFSNYGKEERRGLTRPKGLKQSFVQVREKTMKDFLSTCVRETNRNSCRNVLDCGHMCGGYRNEPNCLPCIQPDCVNSTQPQTADDDCIICYTDHLSEAPVIMLKCGHLFHLHCAKRILQNKWVGAKINFNFTKCPICKETIEHRELDELMVPLKALADDVTHKAMMRLEYDKLDKCPEITTPSSKYYQKPKDFAMDRYIYYLCFKCKKAYFGGTTGTECGAADQQETFKPDILVCPNCRGQKKTRQVSDAAVARAVHSKENRQAKNVIKATTKACPHCGAHTEKNGGCMHMTCIKCKMDWCWLCEKHWEYTCQKRHWFG